MSVAPFDATSLLPAVTDTISSKRSGGSTSLGGLQILPEPIHPPQPADQAVRILDGWGRQRSLPQGGSSLGLAFRGSPRRSGVLDALQVDRARTRGQLLRLAGILDYRWNQLYGLCSTGRTSNSSEHVIATATATTANSGLTRERKEAKRRSQPSRYRTRNGTSAPEMRRPESRKGTCLEGDGQRPKS